MRNIVVIAYSLVCYALIGQTVSGDLLYRNGLDSTAKNILYNISAQGCKNSLYFNESLLKGALEKGVKVSFIVFGLAKEDKNSFLQEEPFLNNYNVIIDRELNEKIKINKGGDNICLLSGNKVLANVLSENAYKLYPILGNIGEDISPKIDSVRVDSSYTFYSGSAAWVNDEYCLVMDMRYNRKLHKINMKNGKIVKRFTFDANDLSEKIYTVIYDGDENLIKRSLGARIKYLKNERLYGDQEFQPENITVNNNRIFLSLRLTFPYIDPTNDTFSRAQTVILELNDTLQIKNYWVSPLDYFGNDFFLPINSDMAPLYFLEDTVCLPVMYLHTPELPVKKYNYGKFILTKDNSIRFHSFLPFLVPDEKSKIMGDYNFSHMSLVEYNSQIAGSFIVYPSVYNLTTNTKIIDIDLVGQKNHKTGKIDTIVFANEINNLKFMVMYFGKYNDNYIIQAKNGEWNTYMLYDKDFNVIKTVYSSKDKDEGKIFHINNDKAFVLKFGGEKNSDDVYIYRKDIRHLFELND